MNLFDGLAWLTLALAVTLVAHLVVDVVIWVAEAATIAVARLG